MGTPEPFKFERLYAEYGTAVFRFCHRLTANRAEAEDLTQDVFVAALTGQDRFRQDSTVRTWLFRIAVYQARERLRKNRRYTPLPKEVSILDPASEGRIDLEKQLDRLPLKLKAAFILVKLEQFTCLEAGRILGIPEGTVKFQVFTAIQQLREAITDPRTLSSKEEIPHAL